MSDYHVTMIEVGVAELKARLSRHLKLVREGREVTVFDRDTPIARIVPYEGRPLEIRRATRRPRDLVLPRRPSRPTDSLAVLMDDRGRR
jgi:antitoxin (DNA-binding transcriptional repressor) of toxin-antitoxin stability system